MKRGLVIICILCFAIVVEGVINGCTTHENITVWNDGSGTLITSPNYPEPYFNNEQVCWTITAVNHVDIWLEDYEIETGFDRLWIYEGSPIMNHVITDLTDSGQDMLYTSSGNVMFVKFTSDHSEPRRGFQACVCDSSVFDCRDKCIYNWNSSPHFNIGWLSYIVVFIVVFVIPAVVTTIAMFVVRKMKQNQRRRQAGIQPVAVMNNQHTDPSATNDGTQPPGLPPYKPYPTMQYPLPTNTGYDTQPPSDFPPPTYPGPPSPAYPGPPSPAYPGPPSPAYPGPPGPYTNYAPVHPGYLGPQSDALPTDNSEPGCNMFAPIHQNPAPYSSQGTEAYANPPMALYPIPPTSPLPPTYIPPTSPLPPTTPLPPISALPPTSVQLYGTGMHPPPVSQPAGTYTDDPRYNV